uniref:Uncharacterized protein n=1 Tax=Arundo donax TaxID=35708 RepID=A0A0A9CQ90_ARUDO
MLQLHLDHFKPRWQIHKRRMRHFDNFQ